MSIRLSSVAFTTVLLAAPALADNWPAWRGPHANGVCDEKNLPVKWSAKEKMVWPFRWLAAENVAWKVSLPDEGNSTPVIWNDRIFITQATSGGRKRSTICFAKKDGKLLWEKTVEYPEKEPTHQTNPYCSASPVTDGQRVVVSHGSAGIYCYDLDGKELWHRDFGKCLHIWGNAASPVIYKDKVFLNFGPGERTFLIAINKSNGNDAWKVDEPGGKLGDKGSSEWIGSWSTPVVAAMNGHDELLLSWPGILKSYDPKNGELRWSCLGLGKDKSSDRLVYTTPLATKEMVVAMAGYGGPAMGVKTGGKGDVTETHRLWRQPTGPQRIGSGVVIGDYVYIVNEPGTAQCIEWKTGKTLWNERIGAAVWGSLVYADGRLYVTNVDGDTIIFAAKPKFETIAKNPLKERTLGSIAVSDGHLFIRTYKNLWCVGK
jgi:outer membrane protein assembly factor BamB